MDRSVPVYLLSTYYVDHGNFLAAKSFLDRSIKSEAIRPGWDVLLPCVQNWLYYLYCGKSG